MLVETGVQVAGMDIGAVVEGVLAVIGAIVVIGKTVSKATGTDKDDKFFEGLDSLVAKIKGLFTKDKSAE